MRKTKHWRDYELLDAGNEIKVERFNNIITQRPEPTATYQTQNKDLKPTAIYDGQWHITEGSDTETIVTYSDMKFNIAIEQGKQVGLFPEQAVNWDWIRSVMKTSTRPLRILNLFAYTGGATIAAAMENVEEIVHIDALRSVNQKAKENIILNGLDDKHIRIIQEDALKFLQREYKRGRQYDGIIMDPPSFGRGPNKEQWKIEDHLPLLMDAAVSVLSDDALFLSVNTYTSNLNADAVLKVMHRSLQKRKFPLNTHSDSIGLDMTYNQHSLQSGLTTRWCFDEDLL